MSMNPTAGSCVRFGMLLLVLLVWVIVASVLPFVPVGSVAMALGRLRDGFSTLAIEPPATFTVVERVVGFFPLGALVAWRLAPSAGRRRVAAAFLVIFGAALAVEAMQAAVATRHPRLSDFLLAAGAGALGVVFAHRIHASILNPYLGGPRRRWVGVALIAAGQLAFVAVLTAAHCSARIAGWDNSFPLLIANELTEDRPWLGCIRSMAIYTDGLSPAEFAELATAPMTPPNAGIRERLHPIARYRFDRVAAGHVANAGVGGSELDLHIANPSGWHAEDGALCLRSGVLIRSGAAADSICREATRTQAITVELDLASGDLAQGGPARIVSISSSPLLRNFTLAQEKGDLVLRVRTLRSGLNGMLVPVQTTQQPLADGWHHVTASYARGAASLWVDGRPARRPVRQYTISTFLFGLDLPATTALLVGTFFWTIGVVACKRASGGKSAHRGPLCSIAGIVLVPMLVAGSLPFAFGHDHEPVLFVSIAIGTLIGWMTVRRSGPPVVGP